MPTYPDNWKDLAKACKQRAGWCCEECGATERLGAAHVNHDPENPNPELRCLCWPCHRRFDAHTGAGHPGKQARRLATRRRNRAKRMAEQDKGRAVQHRRVRHRRAHRARMRYLTMLWLIIYLPYLYKRLELERELSTVHIVDGRAFRYMSGPPRK